MTDPREGRGGFLWSLSQLSGFARETGLRPAYFAIPVLLGLGAALFEGISMGLLVPLAQGVLTRDFSFLHEKRFLGVGAENLFGGPHPADALVFAFLLLAVFSAAVAKNVLQYGSMVGVSYLVRKFSSNLRKLLFSRCLSYGKLYFDRASQGSIHGLILQFTQTIANRLLDLQQLFAWLFMLAAYLALMLVISWPLTLCVVLLFPLLNFSLRWIILRIERTSQLNAQAQSELSKRVFDVLSCIMLVKAYDREREEARGFAALSEHAEACEFSMDKKQCAVPPIQEVIVLAFTLLLISGVALMTSRGWGELPGFLVYFYLLRRSALAFGVLNSMQAALATIQGPVSGIMDMLDAEGKHAVAGGAKEMPPLRQGIEIRDLTYAYKPGVPVLRGLSLVIEKGKMTAIVGPSGAGKSTLIGLLMRFYDCPRGSLFIDGEDIRELSSLCVRARMALVSQEAMLFHDTIEANVAYGLNGRATPKALAQAIGKARLGALLSRLPEGLKTRIGDRGVQLSGGEKQRLSIARAILKGAEILILDEATSSLDTQTEKLIQEAIEEMVQDRTAIVVAHRLSTIQKADKIIFLEGGRVLEQGSLQELLGMRGRFYRSWQEQKF